MKKNLKRLMLVLLALGCAAFLARNWIAREAMEKKMLEATGFKMEIGSLNSGLLKGLMSMRGITISNPPGFADREFMEISDFSMDCKPLTILSGKTHINEMTMNLGNIIVVRLPNGDSNLKQFTAAGSLSRDDCFVDTLKLQIGTVVFRTYGKDGKVASEKFIQVNATTTHRSLEGSSGIMWVMMKTIFLHGRFSKGFFGPKIEPPPIGRVMEMLSGFGKPGSRPPNSTDLPKAN